MNNNLTLIYIVGRGHSGSTLLEILLNRSRDIAAMGEIDLMALQMYRNEHARWVGRCSCDKRVYECEVWGQIVRDIQKEYGMDLIQKPLSWAVSDVGMSEEHEEASFAEMIRFGYHRLVRSFFYELTNKVPSPLDFNYKAWISRRDFVVKRYAEITGVNNVVDASKDLLHMRDIDNYSKINHKFIYLTRDVRGNVWSAIRREQVTAEQEAKQWNRLNSRILRLLNKVDSDKYMHVRYEDLCFKPEDTLRGIHDFIGIEYHTINPDEEFKKRHTIAGNRVRFKKVEEIRHDVSWKEHLTQEDLETIKRVAGKTATKLGYHL